MPFMLFRSSMTINDSFFHLCATSCLLLENVFGFFTKASRTDERNSTFFLIGDGDWEGGGGGVTGGFFYGR